MTKTLYFDCFSGASGDMILGAFLDAGLPLDALERALGSLALDNLELRAERVVRAGIGATRLSVIDRARGERQHESGGADRHHCDTHGRSHSHDAGHHHDHDHGHESDAQHHHEHAPDHSHEHGYSHDHRSVSDIARIVNRSSLSASARERAMALITRLATVEAGIHQMPVEQVHLHEVGALDSIADIVGAVFAFEWFAADRIVASPLNTGSGTVRCAHGVYPVPAPATAQLLTGIPTYVDGPAVELLTPTGALVLTDYVQSWGPRPPMRVTRIGYGAGSRDFEDRPNVVRVFVGEADAGRSDDHVVVLECEIDDMSPQLFGPLRDRLHAAGALDVFYTPVYMKKDRPGQLVTVLVRPGDRERATAILFRETTTLGVRYHDVSRDTLSRETVTVTTAYGDIRIKVARSAGAIVNVMPEFDDCVARADAHQAPVKDVQLAAWAAWRSRQAD